MAFRDKQWYMAAIEQARKNVEQRQSVLERHIASADYSLAAMACDDLKSALLSLNNLENQLADKEG